MTTTHTCEVCDLPDLPRDYDICDDCSEDLHRQQQEDALMDQIRGL